MPPDAVYLLIGLSTLVENVFPPTPSDVAVALGGFLSHRSPIAPALVFLVAWLANLAGSVGLYAVTRRYGRQFFSSRMGRRLVTPEAIVAMEREYLRFGVAGIFLARLIPGFRSFVAPFAGLVGLPPATALLPLAVASATWYGLLTWVGARLGAEWEAISRFLAGLNRTLAMVAVVTAVALTVYLIRRPKPRPRYERLLRIMHRALGQGPEAGPVPAGDPAEAGAAQLMYELARVDLMITPAERELIEEHFRNTWGLAPAAGEVRPSVPQPCIPLDETRELALTLAERFDHTRRMALLERLWRIAGADGTLSAHEERLVQRAAELLGLTPEEVAAAQARVRGGDQSRTP